MHYAQKKQKVNTKRNFIWVGMPTLVDILIPSYFSFLAHRGVGGFITYFIFYDPYYPARHYDCA